VTTDKTNVATPRMRASLSSHHGPQGVLARTWATGSMVLCVVILLGVYLIAYYL